MEAVTIRTKDKGYREYGFAHGEDKYYKFLAREHDYTKRMILHRAAYEANPSISEDVIFSIVSGVSYDEITKIHYIPISKSDFYGYCRKTLAIFRDRLKEEEAL